MVFAKNTKQLASVWAAMRACQQNESQTVLDHGRAVQSRSLTLVRYLQTADEKALEGFAVPRWLHEYRRDLAVTIAPMVVIAAYTEMHDCGKPYCRYTDEDGRVHYPNHAEVSEKIWKTIEFGVENDRIANLILHDMDFHTVKPEQVFDLVKTVEDIPTLLIVALAEIHANAEMFGGIESTGFKIKFAQIERRGKAACKLLYGDPEFPLPSIA